MGSTLLVDAIYMRTLLVTLCHDITSDVLFQNPTTVNTVRGVPSYATKTVAGSPDDGPGGKAERVKRRLENKKRVKERNFMSAQ